MYIDIIICISIVLIYDSILINISIISKKNYLDSHFSYLFIINGYTFNAYISLLYTLPNLRMNYIYIK